VLRLQAAVENCKAHTNSDGTPNGDPLFRIGSCTEYLSQNFPDPIQRAEFQANRGLAFKLIGDFARAISDLDEAVRLDPSSVNFQRRADIYLENGAFDRAITDYTEAIRIDPSNQYAHLWRGIAYGLNDNPDNAIAEFTNEYWATQGEVFFKKYAQQWLLGFAYIRKKDFTRAIDAFTKYLDSPDPWILTERGRIYLEQEQIERAISDFTAAMNVKEARDYFSFYMPNYAESFDGRATAYEHEGNSQKAKADRDEATRRSPKTASEYRARGMIRLARGDYQAAANDAEQAANLDSFNWHWLHNIARAKLSQFILAQSPSHGGNQVAGPLVVPTPSSIIASLAGQTSVRLNGRTFQVEKVDTMADTVTLLGEQSLLRRGLNKLELGVNQFLFWNEELKLEPFAQPYKNSYAIVAAIDDYNRTKDPQKRGPTGQRQLTNMVGTAEELKSVLIALGFPPAHIFTYYDENATTVNLHNALGEFWKGGTYEAADRLFFYFGGHGAGTQGNGYLITYDFDPKRPQFSSFLMSDFVGSQFPNVLAHHVLVALDACSSGLAVPQLMSGTVDNDRLKQFAKLVSIRGDLKESARNLLVAGIGDEPAVAQSGGIFTKALIDGLKGEADLNGDGIIQLEELGIFLESTVRARAAAVGITQDPDIFRATQFGRGKVVFTLPDRN